MTKKRWVGALGAILLPVLLCSCASLTPEQRERRLQVLADQLEHEVELASPRAAVYVTAVRTLVAELRDGDPLTVGEAVDALRQLEPMFRAEMANRGKAPDEIDERVLQIGRVLASIDLLLG